MLTSIIKSFLCLSFFILIILWPTFKYGILQYFNSVENYLTRNRKRVIIITLVLYTVTTVCLQFFHTIDGDESQAWLIARDSGSLYQMFSLMGYEGSPGLWHTILFPIARSGAPYQSIYFINHLFAIVAVSLWLRFAPFPLFVRVLFPFVHVLFTLYSINARSYALSVCLLFTALTLYKTYYSKWFLWSFVFLLFANTNIPATILTCGFALFLFCNWIFLKNKEDGKAFLVICAGILLVLAQVYPPSNNDPEFAGLKFQISPVDITASVITGVPILSIIIYAVVLIQTMMTFKNRNALYGLLAAQTLLFLLFVFKFYGSPRHHFYLILSVLMFLWVNGLKENKKQVNFLFMSTIFLLMVTSTGKSALQIIKSQSNVVKDMANFIKTNIQPDSTTFIACYPDQLGVSLIPYLPIKKVFMTNESRWGSYVIWNWERVSGKFKPEVVQNVINLSEDHHEYKSHYYLTIHEIPQDSVKHYRIELLKEITEQDESYKGSQWSTYYLYKLP